MEIVNLFYQIAREHRDVMAFFYAPAEDKGAGNEFIPYVWLDDPILLNAASATTSTFTVNFDVLSIPEKEVNVAAVQGECLVIGLSFIERLKKTNAVFIPQDWSAISLSRYSDNNAAGWRFTLRLTRGIPVNLCVDYFDPDKELPKITELPVFSVDNPDGCAVFSDAPGLPKIKFG